jgi:uncharacterized protein (TIGR02596 family)
MWRSETSASRSLDFFSGNAGGSRNGFSLLELLFVLTIVAGLGTLSFAAYSAFSQASALSTGAQLVSDLLAEGREDAITQNITVEVRLYADATSAYRVMQLHWLKPDGTKPALQLPLFLPSAVAIDATAEHSTLIGLNTDTVAPDASDPRVNGATRAVHFLADGSTDLDPAESWFLTLRAATQNDPAHFPDNWACLTINPATGKVAILRP